MVAPFEGVLGNNSELRLLEFLLPLKGMDFNLSELAREVGASRPTIHRVVRNLVERNVLRKARKEGRIAYYTLNDQSPFVTLLVEFNNLVVEEMLPDETLMQIGDIMKERVSFRPRISRLQPPELQSSWPGLPFSIHDDFDPIGGQKSRIQLPEPGMPENPWCQGAQKGAG
jgi:DNA-binding transcriptional ArsR family regulator